MPLRGNIVRENKAHRQSSAKIPKGLNRLKKWRRAISREERGFSAKQFPNCYHRAIHIPALLSTPVK